MTLPARFADGMFVGQHGSWNRKPRSGNKVVFVPFEGGVRQATGDVLTGFVKGRTSRWGAPLASPSTSGGTARGDDVGNTIWRLTATNR